MKWAEWKAIQAKLDEIVEPAIRQKYEAARDRVKAIAKDDPERDAALEEFVNVRTECVMDSVNAILNLIPIPEDMPLSEAQQFQKFRLQEFLDAMEFEKKELLPRVDHFLPPAFQTTRGPNAAVTGQNGTSESSPNLPPETAGASVT